jgi:hypothetical protein
VVINLLRKWRLKWSGLVERVSEKRTVVKVFNNIPDGKRSVEKPRKRWMNDVENYLKKMGVERLQENN